MFVINILIDRSFHFQLLHRTTAFAFLPPALSNLLLCVRWAGRSYLTRWPSGLLSLCLGRCSSKAIAHYSGRISIWASTRWRTESEMIIWADFIAGRHLHSCWFAELQCWFVWFQLSNVTSKPLSPHSLFDWTLTTHSTVIQFQAEVLVGYVPRDVKGIFPLENEQGWLSAMFIHANICPPTSHVNVLQKTVDRGLLRNFWLIYCHLFQSM